MTLPSFDKILVAFDGSQYSQQACELAEILAVGYKSKVTIAHVLPPIPSLETRRRREYEVTLENRADIETLKIQAQLEKGGIAAKAKILRAKGSIVDSLIEFSKEGKFDLIVAGTRGLGEFRRMVLGSVSTTLLNHSSVPVLVVRNRVYNLQMRLKRILIATDGSKDSDLALQYALSIAKGAGASLMIVNVVYLPPLAYGTWVPQLDKIYNDLKNEGTKIVSEALELAKENGISDVATKVIENNRSPVWAITKLADEGKFDLIVVGTRGLGGFSKLVLGSVANGVVHYASCSVLITR
jgi:nucleotide-binding universal stress UspA family protein